MNTTNRPLIRTKNFNTIMPFTKKKKKGKKGTKKVVAVKLPKYVRDELLMTCALKGYSKIKCGKGYSQPS